MGMVAEPGSVCGQELSRGLLAPILQIRELRELRQKPPDLITPKSYFPEIGFL